MNGWLQIKGDPSVRRFLFEQTRQGSLFDENMDLLLETTATLLETRGVFHAKIHFSSNQLTCWMYDDPYRYKVFVGDEVLSDSFMAQFRTDIALEEPQIPAHALRPLLNEFKRLRVKDASIYLRNASINRINGIIGMSFSCDGSHYIPFVDFFETVAQL